MKQYTTIIILLLLIADMTACSYNGDVKPNKHSNIQKLTSYKKCNKSLNCKKKGYLQESLDSWLKDEWIPTIQKDEKIQKKYMQEEVIEKDDKKETKLVEKKGRDFTLQEYVDKAGAYLKAHPADYENSHQKRVESLPVIGK